MDSNQELRRLKLAVEQSPATVLISDLCGTIEYVNPTFQALTGYSPEEAVGMNTRVLKSGLHGADFYRELWATIRSGQVWRGKFNNRKKNGELFWEKATIAPVFDAQGAITCYVAVKEDVTELIRAEEALKTAKSEAEAANHAKSAFLANMSHEIRTPLNALLGFIHLLQDTGLSPKQQEYLDKAQASADHLHGMLNDLLDFSRIEAGRIDLECIPFDPREIMENLAGILSLRTAEKGVRLVVDLDPALPARLMGDPLRLGQVLLNFGSNAVKFTAGGEVKVTVTVGESTPGRVRLRFGVADTGIGMTPAELGSLFQPFTQGDDSTTRRFGGTGLGLAISRRLAELMGGTIQVSSSPGQGSTFLLDLELAEALVPTGNRNPRSQVKPAGVQPLKGISVLLAEDDELNQQVAKEILRRAGASVTLAGNGREALSLVRERSFDVVLMDLQMPGLGGLEAAREIRRHPKWADLPIIALTADAEASVRDKVLAAGMTACLSKPLDPVTLVRTLSSHVLKAGFDFPAARATRGQELAGRVHGVDIPGALARLGLDPETYLRLLRRFGAGQGPLLAELEAALEREDPGTALRHVHSLKGAALNLGAHALSGAARDLEVLLQKGGGPGVRERVARMRERSREMVESLALLPQAAPVPASVGGAAMDWPAVLGALEAIRRGLREDDASAGRDLAQLEALLPAGPLRTALAPLKSWIENYDYGRALALWPAFEAQVERLRTAAE